MIKGFATLHGTARYKDRFGGHLSPDHFRQKQSLFFSSIGIGSYLGEPDAETDHLYEASLKLAVESGVNVIDTAINYRNQLSERAFGRAVSALINEGKIQRDEVIICTKGGFLSLDAAYTGDPQTYFLENFLETGLLSAEDVAQGCHAINPEYLEDQLNRSLKNLGVETIDIYYIHNPETQLAEIDRTEFLNRIREAFKWAESKVEEGKIRMYGTATWNGYRVSSDKSDHLSFEELMVLAREVGGTDHQFKAVQLPFNLAMPEAWITPNQRYGAHFVPFLGMVERYDFIVIASASLLQARLTGELPAQIVNRFNSLEHSSQIAIQFARSVPGITTALVGMKNPDHVRVNLDTAKIPRLSENELFSLFQSKAE